MSLALLAIDIDGTLVLKDDSVTPRTRAAVRRAQADGLGLVLATGRRYRTSQRALTALGMRLPVICLGGALVKDAAGETIRSTPFAPAVVRALLALARQHGLALLLQRDAHARGGPDFVVDMAPPWNEPTRGYAQSAGAICQPDPAPENAPCEDVLLVGCFGPRRPLAAFQRQVGEGIGPNSDLGSVLVPSQRTPGWYLEITAGQVNKWTALRRFAADSGVAEEAVCAVGDALNDLPMIRGAGFGVAVGNAAPALKAEADWVTGANHEDGVATLIDRLLEGRASTR